MTLTRAFALTLGIAPLALVSSCAPTPHVVRQVSNKPGYVVEEVVVTGRPVFEKLDSEPSLRIDGSKRFPYATTIHTVVPVETLAQKLDPRKSYQFHLYLTKQDIAVHVGFYNAYLSKVEDHGTIIHDDSVCDVHHCPMEFVEEEGVSWELRSKKEQREMEICHNHGFGSIGCCSPSYFWTWRCPQCAKKVDAFKSKYERW
jgi:hypothetical protein